MFAALLRLVRLLHMGIGISEPKPSEEVFVVVLWVGIIFALVAVVLGGLYFAV
jgi:hypothetical protein